MPDASEWFWSRLACPIDRGALHYSHHVLRCAANHSYPIVEDIPVLHVTHTDPTYPYWEQSFAEVLAPSPAPTADESGIDPFVQDQIVRTNGRLYKSIRGRLKRYPIPELRLPHGENDSRNDGWQPSFLDVGANWGRWTIAAARKGYRSVGVDSSFSALRAARRVARQLKVEAHFVLGDARSLPFTAGAFDLCFSYSVLQHFDKQVARRALEEMSRVVAENGRVLVQMPNCFGLLQLANRARQILTGNRSPFRVRYWTPRELRTVFEQAIGPSQIYADGFLSLDAQAADLDMLPWREAALVRLSEILRRTARIFPPLNFAADSLYVECRNTKTFEN